MVCMKILFAIAPKSSRSDKDKDKYKDKDTLID